MDQLLTVHAFSFLIIATAAGNAVLAAWAFVADLRRGRALGRAFWGALLVVLVVLVIQAAAGLLLAVGGARPKTPLHFLYGILVTTGGVAQFGLRPGGFLRAAVRRNDTPFREARLLALICFTQMALILRAYTTGAWGR